MLEAVMIAAWRRALIDGRRPAWDAHVVTSASRRERSAAFWAESLALSALQRPIALPRPLGADG